ncbi:MAG: TRAP transporter small permease [Betaproteobacteria bacterium]
MAAFQRLVRRLNRGAAVLAAAALLAMIALITLQVILRRLFDSPIDYTDEISGYLLVAVTLLGLSYAMEKGDHIRVDMGIERLPAPVLRGFRIGWCIIGIAFSALLAYETGAYALESARMGSVSIDSQTLLSPIQALLPLGFALLGLELARQLLDALMGRPT